MMRLFFLVVSIASPVLLSAACGSPGPIHPDCDRPALDCESEFSYDGRSFEGGLSISGIGASTKSEPQALRAIDAETERFVAGARRLCQEYNACIVNKETYALRSENMRRRLAKVPELYDEVKHAAGADARRKALSKAFIELAPEAAERSLTLQLSILARRPGEASPRAIGQNESLPTGTQMAFLVRTNQPAYIYLAQKTPQGDTQVLFPDARIFLKNPIDASAALRIPSNAGAWFKLNEEDIGTERVYIVASLEPVLSLEGAIRQLGSGAAPTGALAQITNVENGDCPRALEYELGPEASCVRSRGLEYDDGAASGGAAPPEAASLRARTEAADTVIVQVFEFEHTR